MLQFPSPKLGNRDNVDSWYRYYAGYSSQFVDYAIEHAAPGARNVLDPWNGTGTTTVVAAGKSLDSFGFDINPAAVVVARARLLDDTILGSIPSLSDHISHRSAPVRIADDPLRFWFSPDSASQIRAIQMGIHDLLVDSSDAHAVPTPHVDSLSSLAAFFYVSLFRTVRVLLTPATGSNPTWWKKPAPDAVLRIPKQTIINTFIDAAAELGTGLHRRNQRRSPATSIRVGNSRHLPIEDGSVDAVVSSPPYCTRIDYGVSMRPELAVLRFSEGELRVLRDEMVGTPTMTERVEPSASWGSEASRFIESVASHASRASATYYRRYFTQYYAAMHDSIAELRRVVKPDGAVVLVVQDSFYKDLHNDTPRILMEMASTAGFDSVDRHDFWVPRTLGAINPRSRKYRSEASATESVLVLR
ncbi:hypothetical protein [Leifsonia aquatica]|uniref:hypothetical protein n=1 Tax=Leifsonia aquatica TaxID=144185 RepID=UPI00380D865A